HLVYHLAENGLGAALELLQDQGRDLGRRILTSVDAEADDIPPIIAAEWIVSAILGRDVLHPQSHEALDRGNRRQRLPRRQLFGGGADDDLLWIREGHDGGQEW